MRLLRADFIPDQKGKIQITLCDHIETEGQNLRYAVLSHRAQKGEILFADFSDPDRACSEATKSKEGFAKLETCCKIALDHGLQYVWIDTCCIDRNSSADTSEAINSTFRYYAESELCIAYLDDIEGHAKDDSLFSQSVWFSESWTLPALVASPDLHFYSQTWNRIGSKASLSRQTSFASGIAEKVLIDPSELDSICVSEKMSWGARRMTTRPEDRAYSIMGLFDVNMPLLYGEGGEKAFRRLQLEIIKINPDHTIFAWDSTVCNGDMLAPSISNFINGSDYQATGYPSMFYGHQTAEKIKDVEIFQKHPFLEPRSYEAWNLENRIWKPDFNMTNSGLHIQFPIEPLPIISDRLPPSWKEHRFAILACRTKAGHRIVAICLRRQVQKQHLAFARVPFTGVVTLKFDPAPYRDKLQPITDYNPVWISKESIKRAPSDDKIPASTKLIRYEVWIKSKHTVPITTRATANEPDSSQTNYFSAPPPMYEDAILPDRFTASKHPIQHYANGFLAVNSLDHEVFMFAQGKTMQYLAFGECDGFVWIMGNAVPKVIVKPVDYHTLYQSFYFPAGSSWAKKDQRMRTLVQVQRGIWKPLNVPSDQRVASSVQGQVLGLTYGHVDVVMESGAPGEMALKIYIVNLK